jgi:hypothetical protein
LACAETGVLLLKLSDASPEVRKLDLALVAGVLCGDTVPVGTGLFALLG